MPKKFTPLLRKPQNFEGFQSYGIRISKYAVIPSTLVSDKLTGSGHDEKVDSLTKNLSKSVSNYSLAGIIPFQKKSTFA